MPERLKSKPSAAACSRRWKARKWCTPKPGAGLRFRSRRILSPASKAGAYRGWGGARCLLAAFIRRRAAHALVMSGSFASSGATSRPRPADHHSRAGVARRRCSHMWSRRDGDLRPAPLRLHEDFRPRQDRGRAAAAGLGPSRSAMNPTPRCWRAPVPNRKTSLKAALLDQHVVAGLGNVYVCEALFAFHAAPWRRRSSRMTKGRGGEPHRSRKRLVGGYSCGTRSGHKTGGSSSRSPPDASGDLAIQRASSQVYEPRGRKVPGARAAAASSSGFPRTGARRSGARSAG